MNKPISSFLIHLSSFALLFVFGNTAGAQWIIDGQQVRTLDLNASDPQAVHTDGSRKMEAPLTFAPSLVATAGLFRAYYAPEGQEEEFFLINGSEEYVELSSGCGTLKAGDMLLRSGGLSCTFGHGAAISFDERQFQGGWATDEVPDRSDAVMNRGYADARYLRADAPSDRPLKLAQSLTATDGALQIYASDSGEHMGFFKTLDFQDGLQFATSHSAVLFFGRNSNDGLLIGPSYILQTGYGPSLDFESGQLKGVPWTVSENPVEAQGIVSRGYADSRYLRRSEGVTVNHTLQAGDVLQIQNGIITAINP